MRSDAGMDVTLNIKDSFIILEDEETDFPTGTWDVMIRAVNDQGESPFDSNTVTVTVG